MNSPELFTPTKVDATQMLSEAAQYSVDLRDVHGQQAAKRALEVACAGGHNILFIGPPGAGKTMQAKRIPTILPPMIQRYVSKISGLLLDRIDIHIEVPAVKYKELRAPSSAEDSAAARRRVIRARERQMERFHGEKKIYANAQMVPKMIRKHCAISAEGEKLLENAITRLGLSARAHDRILKVARTIDSGENIEPRHLSEAIQYRTLDRSYWA